MTTEWEIAPSDRVAMLDMAIALCQTMCARDAIRDTSQAEDGAYEAALGFLEREFKRGYVGAQSHVVKTEDTDCGIDE